MQATLQVNPGGDVCVEIGSGSGYVICTAALLMGGAGACFAVDVNPLAAAATLATLRAHDVHAEVRNSACTFATASPNNLTQRIIVLLGERFPPCRLSLYSPLAATRAVIRKSGLVDNTRS
jgi:methylase of polypeptide subunit release factors